LLSANIGMQGFAPKLAKGEIASLSGAADDPRYFQISVPVQPGNSGGALVDERGNVIGIVSAKVLAHGHRVRRRRWRRAGRCRRM
jgi:S1-C subfamily serine protease